MISGFGNGIFALHYLPSHKSLPAEFDLRRLISHAISFLMFSLSHHCFLSVFSAPLACEGVVFIIC